MGEETEALLAEVRRNREERMHGRSNVTDSVKAVREMREGRDGQGERTYPATDDLRYTVSEAYPWGTRWYVWRETRQPDGSWDDGTDHQCGPAFRSLTKACAHAERLAAKATQDAAE